MAKKRVDGAVFRFSYSHVQTGGKLVNTGEALEQMGSGRVCLELTDRGLDALPLSAGEVAARAGRLTKVVGKLRRQGVRAELAVSPAAVGGKGAGARRRALGRLYVAAATSGARTMWVDHGGFAEDGAGAREELMGELRAIRQAVTGAAARPVRLGLIGARPREYLARGTNGVELARVLAGRDRPLLAQGVGFGRDCDRCGVLRVGQELAIVGAQAEAAGSRAWSGRHSLHRPPAGKHRPGRRSRRRRCPRAAGSPSTQRHRAYPDRHLHRR